MNAFAHFRQDHPRAAAILSTWLAKISKHLALLGCFVIAGKAASGLAVGEVTIFLLMVFASAAHLCGRALAPLRLNEHEAGCDR